MLKSRVFAVRTSSWSSDDSRHVEFCSIDTFFCPLQLVLVTQCLINPSLMDSTSVRRHDKS